MWFLINTESFLMVEKETLSACLPFLLVQLVCGSVRMFEGVLTASQAAGSIALFSIEIRDCTLWTSLMLLNPGMVRK